MQCNYFVVIIRESTKLIVFRSSYGKYLYSWDSFARWPVNNPVIADHLPTLSRLLLFVLLYFCFIYIITIGNS